MRKDSREINDCFEDLIVAYTAARDIWNARNPDMQVFLTQTYRSTQTQSALYEIGRTKPGKIVTNAKPLNSPHNFYPSCAFDISFKDINGKVNWEERHFTDFAALIGSMYPYVGWGGNFSFKDFPHFEMKNWKELVKLKKVLP